MATYEQEIAELQAWGRKEGQKGYRPTDPTSMRLMLDGFFHRFKLTPPASRVVLERDPFSGEEVWLFVGLSEWWDAPGAPVITQAELGAVQTGRLRRIAQTAFRCAAKRGELDRLTLLRGGQQTEFCRSLGIGA